MADQTRDVDVTLRLKKEGDAGAFKETAADIAGLAEPTMRSTELVSQFFDLLGKATGGGEDLERIREAMNGVAEAADRFGEAKGLDEQRKSIGELRTSWERFGETVDKSLKDSTEAAATFAEGLEDIKKVERDLASPLESSFKRATSAVETFGKEAEAGGARAQRAATQAKVALEQYTEELAAAKRAGAGLTDEQVAGLTRLQESYQAAIRKTADFKNAQEDVAKSIKTVRAETDVGRGSINDLGDIVERVNPKLGDLVAKGFAIAGAFDAGWSAGSRLRKVINELTDGALDKGLQKFISDALDLDSGLSDLADTGDRVRNMMNVLEKNGIDPLGKSLEELEAAYAGLIAKKREAAAAAEAQAAASEKAETTSRRVREEVSEEEKAVASLTKEILGPGQQAHASLAEQAVIAQRAFAGLGDMTQLNSQQMARLREQVAALVERFRSSQQDIPQWLTDAADASGVFVAAMERAGGKIETFIGKGKELKGAELAAELKKLEQAGSGVGDSFQEAGQQADQGLGKIGDATGKVADSGAEAATAVDAVKAALGGVRDGAGPAATEVERLAAAFSKLDSIKLSGIRAELAAVRQDAVAALDAVNKLAEGNG